MFLAECHWVSKLDHIDKHSTKRLTGAIILILFPDQTEYGTMGRQQNHLTLIAQKL